MYCASFYFGMHISPCSLHQLRDIFVVLDTQGSGTVTLVDLKNALKNMHSDKLMDDETIEKLFHGIDGKPRGSFYIAGYR